MKFKVTTDGTPYGTSVTNADTGEKVDGVMNVQINMGTRGQHSADITIRCWDVKLEAELAHLPKP